ncbi:MAG: hypothetical protein PUB10_10290 [Clostridiales bacterium]|nr:hypothetical protein [Clostridiales bacterium]
MNRNRNLKKATAVCLACCLTLTSTMPYTSASAFTCCYPERKSQTSISSASSVSDPSAVSKEETVYVKQDTTGASTKITVSDWLKNAGNGAVTDLSSLSDIKNIKGDETFTQKGEALTWNAAGKDIYYQGATSKELPVTMSIRYQLDGKEISGEDLAGKTGELKMTIQYTNHEKTTTKQNGKDVTIYTPFAMVSGLILSSDHFKNVEIDHGEVTSDSKNVMVVGMAFPGLQESLGLDNSDLNLEFPAQLTITADVTDCKMGSIYTIATTDVFEKLDLDSIDSFSDLEDSLTDMSDASHQLMNGASQLSDGLQTLNDKMGDFTSGVSDLNNGLQSLSEGGSDLVSGAGQLTKGMDQLKKGIDKLTENSETLTKGSASVKQGLENLQTSVCSESNPENLLNSSSQVSGGIEQLAAGIQKADQAMSYDSFKQALSAKGVDVDKVVASNEQVIKTLEAQLSTLDTGIKKLEAAGQTSSTEYIQYKTQYETINQILATVKPLLQGDSQIIKEGVSSYLSGVKGSAETKTGTSYLYTSAKTLDQSYQKFDKGIKQLSKGVNKLADSYDTLDEGLNTYVNGVDQLGEKLPYLSDGINSLKQGADKMGSGAMKLGNGGLSLKKGASTISSGVSKLTTGAVKLEQGTKEFDREAIQKLKEVYDDNIKHAKDRLELIKDCASDYRAFAGITDGMEGSVTFIMETDPIELPDEND